MRGSTIAERFRIEDIARKGGMGTVFRARDVATGNLVALKMVEGAFANARFEREASVLAALRDPRIVRYIAHGAASDGRMYLAMEWLEGVPLDERLQSGPLGFDASMSIGKALAHALAAAHAAGVVHRDVKPGNVMLRGGSSDDAVLVDFGLALAHESTRTLTVSGVAIGTPRYMAPEQARGERTIDARADLFSLGCVLFECFAGAAPFVGEHAIAVLAKILFEPAPRLGCVVPATPAALEALVATMLEKRAADRPASADVVAEALGALAGGPRSGPSGSSAQPPPWSPDGRGVISATERRFTTVLLARVPGVRHGQPRPADGEPSSPEVDESGSPWAAAGATASTADAPSMLGKHSMIGQAASAAGVSIVPLANGMFVAANIGTDAAHRAARCALMLRARLPGVSVAIASGRWIVADSVPVGDAIDRAAKLLANDAGTTVLDEATASAIEARFELDRDAVQGRITLLGERALEERTILGRLVPFVGRERELALLEATFRECAEEPVARATILLAPPGMGKTRLQREMVRRLTASSATAPPRVWFGIADPVMDRAPLALAGDVLRRLVGLADDEPLVARRALIADRVRATMGEASHPMRLACFLGEILRAPFEDAADPALRAARRDPELMAASIDDAFVSFVGAEAQGEPLVLVLEDVHWADAASLRLFATLLGRSENRPLMLLALARPSLDEWHPRLWEELRCQRVVLEPLLRKASERLARAVIGERPEVEAIVQRAEGNALFVEELARACAEGRAPADPPPTVAAATEARLAAFDADTRHVLRAAAVFGERFWSAGVSRLMGRSVARVDASIEHLRELEVVWRASASRFAEHAEYEFRHALVRDAAYGMLTEEDRRLGHALAAEWLETFDAGQEMADALMSHYEQAEMWAAAVRHGRKAADRAIRLSRFSEALAVLERARVWAAHLHDEGGRHSALVELLLEQERICDLMIDRGRQRRVLDELLAELSPGRDDAWLATVYARKGELHSLSGEPEPARRALEEALRLSRAASDLGRERVALKGMAFLAWQERRYADAVAHNEGVLALSRQLQEPALASDLVNMGISLVRAGEMVRARAVLDELGALSFESPGEAVHALHFRALYFSRVGDVSEELASHRDAMAVAEQHGLIPYKLVTLDAIAASLCRTGRAEEGLATYARLAQVARSSEFRPQLARALQAHGDILVDLGRNVEAMPLFAESVDVWEKLGVLDGALTAAEHAARASRVMQDTALTSRAHARAVELARRCGDTRREGALLNSLGIVQFKVGDHARALETYDRALAIFQADGDRVHCALMQNSAAATLQKLGDHRGARQRLRVGLRLAREVGERLLEGHALALEGDSHRAEGSPEDAEESYQASLRIRREVGDRRGEGWMLQRLALLALDAGDASRAGALRDEALACAGACGDMELAEVCVTLM